MRAVDIEAVRRAAAAGRITQKQAEQLERLGDIPEDYADMPYELAIAYIMATFPLDHDNARLCYALLQGETDVIDVDEDGTRHYV